MPHHFLLQAILLLSHRINSPTIFKLFLLGFSRLLGRRWGAVAAILGIGLYTVLVGASYSVLRAAVMVSLALLW